MTNKQLQELLKQYPDDAEIVIADSQISDWEIAVDYEKGTIFIETVPKV